MLILIKGPLASGKTTLAGRLAADLSLRPVVWPLSEEQLAESQEFMGEWIDVKRYFAACRHVDLERVLTVLQIHKLRELPPPPRWRPGAPIEEMMRWRVRIFEDLYAGRFLPDLIQLTCQLVDSLPHAIVEGEILGTRLRDSNLARSLRRRYARTPTLLLRAHRLRADGGQRRYLVTGNGRQLDHDTMVAALWRRADGGLGVKPTLGLTWSGTGQSGAPRPSELSMEAPSAAGRQA